MLFFLLILSICWTQEPEFMTQEELTVFSSRVPKEFVDLEVVIPTIHLEIGYHNSDNFTGRPLPGYGVPKAWLLPEAALALSKVQEELSWEDLSLLVYDAYRPRRASEAMVAWAKRTNQQELIDKGFIAEKSGHNHGHTIDVTIIDLKTGKPLEMGGDWDVFNKVSHIKNAVGIAAKNRNKLQLVMEKYGFRGYSKEWWHFRYPMVGTIARDVPYGCFEAKEWKFQTPENWDKPGYISDPIVQHVKGQLQCLPVF
jgi:zinc D-Ala-D-Ala dipeptidase